MSALLSWYLWMGKYLSKNFTSSSCQALTVIGGKVSNQSFALLVKENLKSLNLLADSVTFGGFV
ncbi:hypothetical protein A2U01_0086928 [Trifolium medium]|uniref:Uncharacterized protein n=1 Tax=Trifolium medium TaxID=97028 RepID=A0A392TZL2_9FABA|nr:hypothetical protein [Trifolium medium]